MSHVDVSGQYAQQERRLESGRIHETPGSYTICSMRREKKGRRMALKKTVVIPITIALGPTLLYLMASFIYLYIFC